MRELPALAEHRGARYAALVVLYIGQGVPQGLLVVALPAFLAERGVSAAAVGAYLSAVLLPFALKAVAGPFVDRHTYLPMGRRRPWILACGGSMVAGFVAMAHVPDPVAHIGWLMAAGVAVNASVALLDAAVDGMAVDLVPHDEQPRANALMWGGATIGVALSAVGSALALDASGVAGAAVALAVALGGLLIVPLVLRERPGERLLPWTAGRASDAARAYQPRGWRRVGRELRAGMLHPASLALMGAAACAGALDGLVIAFMPTFAVQTLGWQDAEYASLVAAGQVAAGLLGMGLGSVLIQRVGRVRMLGVLAALVACVLLGMALVPGAWSVRVTLVVFALGYLSAFVLLTISLLATGMSLCNRVVAATQFALFTAAMNVGRSLGSALVGPLDHVLGPSMLLTVAAGLAGLVLALTLRIRSEQADRPLARPTPPRVARARDPGGAREADPRDASRRRRRVDAGGAVDARTRVA